MHIVIVDSSRVVLKIITGLLEPRGHVVSAFTDSAAARDFLEETPSVRVLITSLEVRPVTGLELCWSARLLAEARRPLYVVTMSSARNARNLAEALDSGADDFIEKPPSAEELHARLRAAERLTTMQNELIRLAETDPLTGLLNRRAFFARVGAATERAGNHGALSAVLADIDHFKRINDEHGHDVGDAAIKAVAELLGAQGIVGRLGGEEFAVVLPGLSLAEAEAVAGRLRLQVRDLRIRGSRGPVRMTCSFGVSTWCEGDSVTALTKRADIALYEAKTSGRDRVVSAENDLVLARAG
ncbi:diguanylate cyclase [Methylobacterium sp. E-041]|jgi:two-component system cell cycle response regulator|uniref:GGDEF domain-containing protein n=1 Tax=unclassified Methylobacterium TaxID=2615210 RepID=UPI0011CBFC40|nr:MULTISPECIES: diguanylate cyclase [unclassified Methylobacterium]MCJ2078665.1 diguanylate cyclase [Methylobacterium sp. E-016]MCJ2108722.1 diguanylate cyclase [Methylobacterium sp. E-041]TXM91348.1 diguanylate cyclase [Methylobacterium sp. WL116]TXN27965.1 diguanylate cyclase [Methylobacterium sp. WL93]TXN50868.1 diguanylate cyclase [Methylobacterium sp. WL119]